MEAIEMPRGFQRITLSCLLAVLLFIGSLFRWEYGQTMDIHSVEQENTFQDKQLEDLKSSLKELKDSVRDVDKKTDEIKTILINAKI
jgi:hypothetical protein